MGMSEDTLTIEPTDAGFFGISCSCGWTGDEWTTEDDAQAEGDDHWDDNHWGTNE